MMKLQSACLCRVTFLLLCRATSGKPIFVNSERRSSMSGAVYSTNSKPSVPIGLSRPRIVFSGASVAISGLLCAATALRAAAFQGAKLPRVRAPRTPEWGRSRAPTREAAPDAALDIGHDRGLSELHG